MYFTAMTDAGHHIKLLQESLGEYSGTITTLRGVGYRFEGC